MEAMTAWVKGRVAVPWREVSRRYDFYKNCDVLVITNEPESRDDRSARVGVGARP